MTLEYFVCITFLNEIWIKDYKRRLQNTFKESKPFTLTNFQSSKGWILCDLVTFLALSFLICEIELDWVTFKVPLALKITAYMNQHVYLELTNERLDIREIINR